MFSHEDTPTEQWVEAAFLYHPGLSYRQVGEWLGHSHQAVHEWYTALADLFEPEPDEHGTVGVDDQGVLSGQRSTEAYEVTQAETSPGRSELNVLLFLRAVLVVDRGPWYN